MQSYFALMAAIFAVLLGNGIIAKEERDKTVEFSLTLPIPRHKLITGKVAAALVNCVVFVLVMWGGSVIAAQPFTPDETFYQFLQMLMLSSFFIEVIFLTIGVLLGAAMKEYKRSGSVAVFILFGTFIFSIVSALSEKLEFLKYFSPFVYFDPLKILNESKFDPGYLAVSAGGPSPTGFRHPAGSHPVPSPSRPLPCPWYRRVWSPAKRSTPDTHPCQPAQSDPCPSMAIHFSQSSFWQPFPLDNF